MDYPKGHISLHFAVFILIVSSTSHALVDRFLEENFPDHLSPHHLDEEDESQSTSCDFESPCLWTLSNHSVQGDWQIMSPQQPSENTKVTSVRPVTDQSEGSSDGHFLLLSPSAEAAEKCEYHLISPVLRGSGMLCSLQLALYEARSTAGNFTVLVRSLLSGSAISSTPLQGTRREGDRTEWDVLEAVIGQVDEPFRVILIYSSCLMKDGATLALDSLQFRDCDPGQLELGLGADCDESFHCDTGGCIDQSRVCDFNSDCPLGEDEGFICDALPLGSHCSFEGNACGWSVSREPFSWKRVSRDELTERGDIMGSALHSTPGHFLFLPVREKSSQKEASVRSVTFPLPVSKTACQVTALWERGSNADIALDDVALGAACFDTGIWVPVV
ncbi:tyrosine-protein kinase receptor-like [Aplochiton taeniatus]